MFVKQTIQESVINNFVTWQLIFVLSDFPHLGRMDGLRQKLENQGLRDVVYMVVNHQGEQAQRLHAMLAQRLSENITLYKQDVQQPDVWQALSGEKDDFLVYDRFVTCSGEFVFAREITSKRFSFCLVLTVLFYPQVWASHPPHFTSILHHRTRPC